MEVFNHIASFVRNQDLYPHTVKLTFRGKRNFKTMWGGVISISIKILILMYSLMMLKSLISRGNTSKNVNTEVKVLDEDFTKHYIGKGEFSIAAKLVGPNPELILDPTYFNFGFYQMSYARPKNSGEIFSAEETEIGHQYWGDSFPNVAPATYERLNISYSLCPNNTDYYLSSNFNSDKYSTFEMRLQKCSLSSGWKTDAEIAAVFDTHYIDVSLINSYFDFDDYENPVKLYLEDLDIYSMLSTQSQMVTTKVIKNYYSREDNLFMNLFPDEGSFYSVGERRSSFSSVAINRNSYFSFMISLSQQYSTYERTVFTFFDFFGLLGGVFEILMIAGSYVVKGVSFHQFAHAVVSSLYTVNHKQNDTEATRVVPLSTTISRIHFSNKSRIESSVSSVPEESKVGWKMSQEPNF